MSSSPYRDPEKEELQSLDSMNEDQLKSAIKKLVEKGEVSAATVNRIIRENREEYNRLFAEVGY